jgi:hypothetical protein
MNVTPRFKRSDMLLKGRRSAPRCLAAIYWTVALTALVGCGRNDLPATVEGTLRRGGNPLDNCLVVFLPEARDGVRTWRFVGLTDAQGRYRLQGEDRREGAKLGVHRITIEDLSISTGVPRRDHGAVDAEDTADAQVPSVVRRSRVPEHYTSASRTPLRKEVQPGHQVIDLEID